MKELRSLKNHSPVTLHYSPAISNINENPATVPLPVLSGGNEMGISQVTTEQTSVSWFHFDADVSVATGTDTVKQTGQQ